MTHRFTTWLILAFSAITVSACTVVPPRVAYQPGYVVTPPPPRVYVEPVPPPVVVVPAPRPYYYGPPAWGYREHHHWH